MPRSTPHCRGARRAERRARRARHLADWAAGLVLGIALAGIAIDYGRRTAPSPAQLPAAQTLTQFPGP